MSFGEEPGSLVLLDGTVYGPQSVEIDTVSFDRPVFRFRTALGTKSRTPKGIIPVREAYESLYRALAAEPVCASEWTATSFSPPGSGSSRALGITLEDSSVSAAFLKQIPDSFRALARGNKFSWDEAVSPANFVPQSLDCISDKDYVKVFAAKEFTKNCHNVMLGTTDKLPFLHKSVTEEEHGARLNFLSCLNMTLCLEALLLQQGKDAAISPAISGALKMSLQPLLGVVLLPLQEEVGAPEEGFEVVQSGGHFSSEPDCFVSSDGGHS